MLRDLEAVVDAGVTHITHYELNVAGRTDFSRHRRHELPSTEQNLEMYRTGRDFLLSRGFTQATPYDFEHTGTLPSSYLYEELFRRPFQDAGGQLLGHDAWGWGFAGVSFFFGSPQFPGWAYLNQVRVDDYFRDLDAGPLPGAARLPLLGDRPAAAPAVPGAAGPVRRPAGATPRSSAVTCGKSTGRYGKRS